ncbi:hypothetical protein [Priestia flexa]|uniref:hypothetical protein n=1 Tax=Priestia flexa TaxID=86664 RepID=UPI0004736BC4|nr:hypothetical protein [Priestia flexa]
MLYGEYQGKKLYSDYNPKYNEEEFDNKVTSLIELMEGNELISSTFKHENDYISVSLINDEIHIDNVTEDYED